RFEESYRLDPALGTLFNLASCEEQRGRLAGAWEHYRRVLEALEPTDRRFAMVQTRFNELDARVPRLVVSLAPSAPKDVEVARDGVRLTHGSFGVPLPLNPGEHELTVTAPGHDARSYRIVGVPKATTRLELDVGKQIAVPSPPARKGSTPVRAPQKAENP